MRRSKSSLAAKVCIEISEIEGQRIRPIICNSNNSFYRQNQLISARATILNQDAAGRLQANVAFFFHGLQTH